MKREKMPMEAWIFPNAAPLLDELAAFARVQRRVRSRFDPVISAHCGDVSVECVRGSDDSFE
jgi:hypothetical protein